MNNLDVIRTLIAQGAIFYCSHSGGKDSQAMYSYLKNLVPFNQLVVVHADLGVVEWGGVQGHIEDTIDHRMNVVSAVTKDGQPKTLLSMAKQRGMWPSSAHRQCTSDLKRAPIMKFIRNDIKTRGATIAVNCMGIRAEESSARAKKISFELNKNETVNKRVKRTVYNWMPIFDLSTDEVFDSIYANDQLPFWAYGKRGELNTRLSCVFCIMGSQKDLRHGAVENPDLFKTYVELEKEIGHTLFMKKGKPVPLEEHVGLRVDQLIPTTTIT